MRRSLAVALSVLSLAAAAAAEPPKLELSSHVVVRDGPEEFGGLSALTVSADGKRAQVLSDRGRIFEVGLWREGEDRLKRVAVLRTKYLYLYEPEHRIDSEGLAKAPDGGMFVSSERPDMILHYPARSHWPDVTLPVPEPEWLAPNRGIEALAVDPEGRLVAIPELPREGEAGFPVFRREGEAWRRVATLEAVGPFSVVGADFGPDGRLYVLERAFSLLGFSSRLRRLTLAEGAAVAETLFQSPVGQFDNLEGVALWQDGTGALRILLVSDDNFFSVQRTEFVEFVLRE